MARAERAALLLAAVEHTMHLCVAFATATSHNTHMWALYGMDHDRSFEVAGFFWYVKNRMQGVVYRAHGTRISPCSGYAVVGSVNIYEFTCVCVCAVRVHGSAMLI